jgi:hypothetical protein
MEELHVQLRISNFFLQTVRIWGSGPTHRRKYRKTWLSGCAYVQSIRTVVVSVDVALVRQRQVCILLPAQTL